MTTTVGSPAAATGAAARRTGRARALLPGALAAGLALAALLTAPPGASAATTGLSLTATASPASVAQAGDHVDYTVVVRNRGDQGVRDLLVTLPTRGVSAPVCAPVPLGGTLGAGATTTCRASRTVGLEDLGGAEVDATVRATGVPVGSRTAVNASATVSVSVATARPVATDDTAGAVDGGPSVLLAGASDDRRGPSGGAPIVPARTVLVGSAYTLSYDGRRADSNAGNGTWSVLPDGRVRFSPGYQTAFTNQTIDYRVFDAAGRSALGTLAVLVQPGPASPTVHAYTTPQGRAVALDPLGADDPGRNADGSPSSFEPTSLKVNAGGFPPPYPTTNGLDGKSVDLGLVGRFVVDSGKVVFTPVTGFVGKASVSYLATTTSGVRVSGTLDVTVTAVPGGPTLVRPALPVATDDHVVTTTQIATALPAQLNDIPGANPFVNSKLTFPGDQLSRLPAGSTIVYRDGVTLTVPGQGVYQTQFGTQQVLFTPKAGFVGDAAPVQYRVTDTAGNTARATLSVTVLPGITERADFKGTAQGRPVTVDVRANDDLGPSDRTWTSAPVTEPRLTTHGNPGSVLSGTYQEKLTVPGQGVYTVDPGSGTVTFAPAPGFVGASTASIGLRIQVQRPDIGSEELGFETRLTVTVTASTPVARGDSASTSVGQPVTVPVLGNDSAGSAAVPLVGSSVRLRTTSSLPAGSVLYGDAKTLKVAGRGVFLVSGTGQVTFVPLGTSTGPVPTIGYQVADANGTTARSSLTVAVVSR
ncbi:Ig-like domain-containing protein [Microlunatus flavus]|uniref:Conserved repeat domain-containing protein n=1 Tax=Microlunatus flavus TaxID=1036181 RepID=A0A1H9LUP3_9ACTN|nr:Ig-like domain-containing protein [Microlunatus flavus]SER15134.1 conserved repeat domain-containing protein [Microlunatus flavus]